MSVSTTSLTFLACRLSDNLTWTSWTRLNGTWPKWVSHCLEADFGQSLAVDDLHRSQNALAAAVDALNAEPEEHMIQA